ncbi:hypothetical protein GCM10019016_041500 [Streptomyces prasinosporus]|uniref:Uncharacterized protein n=1 Tax=Streptomyces prasinosporus TaxID=68256 RepID=A0ABP6TQL2_9ACTN
MKPPVEAPGVQRPPPLDDQSPRHEGVERARPALCPAARHVVRGRSRRGDDDRGGGLHLRGGLGRDGPADADPARGDQLAGVLARPRQLAADQFRVETAACDSCHVRFSSCVRVPTSDRVPKGLTGG